SDQARQFLMALAGLEERVLHPLRHGLGLPRPLLLRLEIALDEVDVGTGAEEQDDHEDQPHHAHGGATFTTSHPGISEKGRWSEVLARSTIAIRRSAGRKT